MNKETLLEIYKENLYKLFIDTDGIKSYFSMVNYWNNISLEQAKNSKSLATEFKEKRQQEVQEIINNNLREQEELLSLCSTEEYIKKIGAFVFNGEINDIALYMFNNDFLFEMVRMALYILENEEINKYKEDLFYYIEKENINNIKHIVDFEVDKTKEILVYIADLLSNCYEQSNSQDNKKRLYKEYSDRAIYSFNNISKALVTTRNNAFSISTIKFGNLNINLSSTEESDKKVKQLTGFEKKVLDTIIGYFREDIKEFTDNQIAREIFGKEDRKNEVYTKPTEEQLKEVNLAIDKLRTTLIEVVSDKVNNAIFNSKNTFINVEQIGIKKDGDSAQIYKLISTPFYYTYNIATGGRFIEYNNSAYTKRIDGIKKTPKAQSLRMYLTERISNIVEGLESPNLDLNEIYELEDIKAETRKQRYDTSFKVDTMLKELTKLYPFTYTPSKKGKTLIGYRIKIKQH